MALSVWVNGCCPRQSLTDVGATGLRAGISSVPYTVFINDMPLQLQTDRDIYTDDTVTHTADKKLEVVEPKLQMTSIHGATIIIWEFIMVKHMHS